MAYPDKTLGRDVHQESADKFLTGNRQFLPLPLIFIIFDSKCNGRIRHLFDAVIADSNPMCVFAKVFDDRLRTMERLHNSKESIFLYSRDPITP